MSRESETGKTLLPNQEAIPGPSPWKSILSRPRGKEERQERQEEEKDLIQEERQGRQEEKERTKEGSTEARVMEVRSDLGKEQETPSKDRQDPPGGVPVSGLRTVGRDPANLPERLAAKVSHINGAIFAE